MLTVIRRRNKTSGAVKLPHSRMTRLIAFSIAATSPMGFSVSAKALTYFSATVSGERYGLPGYAGTFGSNDAQEKSPAFKALSGVNWAVSASSNDSGGGTVNTNTLIATQSPDDPSYIHELSSIADLYYEFTIGGPNTTMKIPVLLSGSGSVSAAVERGYASAGFAFSSFADPVSIDYNITDNLGFTDTGRSLTVSQVVELTPGSLLRLNLHAYAWVTNPDFDTGGVEQSTASVDPTFTIMGDFGRDYYFVGLPESAIGHAAPTAVPEPASWTMMISGFGLVGGVLHCRGKRRAPRRAALA